MRKHTSLKNITNVLCHEPISRIVMSEYQYRAKSMLNVSDPIDTITMLESIKALECNVVFNDIVDWTYETISEKSDSEDFVLYGDLHDPIVGTIVVMHLRLLDGHTVEQMETELNKTIFI